MTLPKKYHAHGKLMLAGEYLVLQGATALVMPVRFGQQLTVFPPSRKGEIHWLAYEKGEVWFSLRMKAESLEIIETNLNDIALKTVKLLRAIYTLNPDFQKSFQGADLQFNIDFNRLWGLGTSSTLISLLAQWTRTYPYLLHRAVSKGSGFDIACATADSPLLFSMAENKPHIHPVRILPGIKKYIYFVYLGKKEDSEKAVIHYLKNHNPDPQIIDEITDISIRLSRSSSPDKWADLIRYHENRISEFLKKEALETRFPGLPGAIKSLGAWGGDFAMVVSENPLGALKTYFLDHGISDIFSFEEMELVSRNAYTENPAI